MRLSFPVVFSIGPISLSAHFLFESLAYTIGFALYRRNRRLSGDFLASADRLTVLVAALLGAALGSKLLFWLEDPVRTLHNRTDLAYWLSGKTIVGALLGGTLAVEWVKKRVGIARRTGDLFVLPMIVAIAIGRIGCFLAGLPDNTFGTPTRLPWGVNFGDGISRHPTQLYEILFLIGLAFVVKRFAALPHREGDLYRLFLVSYLTFRLLIDLLKPEPSFLGLSSIQWASLAGILAYWRDLPFLLAPRRSRPQPWVTASAPTSSTTQPSPSAPPASAGATQKSSSRTKASTS